MIRPFLFCRQRGTKSCYLLRKLPDRWRGCDQPSSKATGLVTGVGEWTEGASAYCSPRWSPHSVYGVGIFSWGAQGGPCGHTVRLSFAQRLCAQTSCTCPEGGHPLLPTKAPVLRSLLPRGCTQRHQRDEGWPYVSCRQGDFSGPQFVLLRNEGPPGTILTSSL